MPSSTKPRKAYRPKPIGRPVLQRMHTDLMLPVYSALEALRVSTDDEALESARHTLAAVLDYMLVALGDCGRNVGPIVHGLDALREVVARHERTGVYRATGGELQALRAAVVYADAQMPTLRTDQLASALVKVDAVMAGIEVKA